MDFDQLQQAWNQRSVVQDKHQIDMNELLNALQHRSSSVTNKLKTGNILAMILVGALWLAAFYILVAYFDDYVSRSIGLISITILSVFEWIIARNNWQLLSLDSQVLNLKEALIRRLDYFRFGHFWTMVALGLSGLFIYLLGSTIYRNMVHGGVFMDSEDTLVSLAFGMMAFVIGFFSHGQVYKRYHLELTSCLQDLQDEVIRTEQPGPARLRVYIQYILFATGLLFLLSVIYLILT